MCTPALKLVFAVAALLPLSLAHSVHAQQRHPLDEPHIAAKLQLGLGGSVDYTVSGNGGSVTRNSDLGVSFGVAGEYVYPLHRYFALGGQLGFLTWQSSAGSDSEGGRNFLFDLAVVPKGKYAMLDDTLELYLGLPIGVGLDVLNEVNARNTLVLPAIGGAAGSEVEGGAALGFVIGLLAGARYQLTDSVGLLAELGYMYRTFGHSVTSSVGAGSGLVSLSRDTDVSVSFGQFALNLGAYF